MPPRLRPVLAGIGIGAVVGCTPLVEPIGALARVLFGLGLFLNYASIGVLVALLPLRGPRWLFGLLVGLGYSLPGALFTAVPVPLQADAPRYYRTFAAGGPRELALTLVFGAVTGLLAGALRPAGQRRDH